MTQSQAFSCLHFKGIDINFIYIFLANSHVREISFLFLRNEILLQLYKNIKKIFEQNCNRHMY